MFEDGAESRGRYVQPGGNVTFEAEIRPLGLEEECPNLRARGESIAAAISIVRRFWGGLTNVMRPTLSPMLMSKEDMRRFLQFLYPRCFLN